MHTNNSANDPIPSRPVLELAKSGLRHSVLAIVLLIWLAIIYFTVVAIVNLENRGSVDGALSWGCVFAAVLYVAAIAATAFAGIVLRSKSSFG